MKRQIKSFTGFGTLKEMHSFFQLLNFQGRAEKLRARDAQTNFAAERKIKFSVRCAPSLFILSSDPANRCSRVVVETGLESFLAPTGLRG
jgi:hypothetical protein